MAALVALAMQLGAPADVHAVGPIATKAKCGPNDRKESGLQGQTTLAERFASGPYKAYNCNLDLAGQRVGEGAGVGLAITERCAYVSQWHLTPPLVSSLKEPGLMVLDVKDSANPKLVKYLRTPAMQHPNESPVLHPGRNLLVAQHFDEADVYGKTTDIYDISDCLNPVLRFSGVIPGFTLHQGEFNKEGTILWGTTGPVIRDKYPDLGDSISALDITDPSRPRILAQWRPQDPRLWRLHGFSVSDDGNTGYMTIGRHSYSLVNGKVTPAPFQGIGVLDVGEVQARKPSPQIAKLSELFWDDVVHNQYLRPVTIKGRKYLFDNRIDGVISTAAAVANTRPHMSAEEACSLGKPAWGYITLIDVEDPRRPVLASSLRLEVHDAKHCLATAFDPVYGHGYSPLACAADNAQDAKKIVCGFSESGIRVFDVRDVKHPREIAYYKPPAVGSEPRPASPYERYRDVKGRTSQANQFHSADGAIYPAFARGGKEIWFTSFDNGFQVLRFSEELMSREKDLFEEIPTCFGGLRPPHGCPE